MTTKRWSCVRKGPSSLDRGSGRISMLDTSFDLAQVREYVRDKVEASLETARRNVDAQEMAAMPRYAPSHYEIWKYYQSTSKARVKVPQNLMVPVFTHLSPRTYERLAWAHQTPPWQPSSCTRLWTPGQSVVSLDSLQPAHGPMQGVCVPTSILRRYSSLPCRVTMLLTMPAAHFFCKRLT